MAERSLDRAEKWAEQFLKHLPVAAWIKSRDGYYLYVKPARFFPAMPDGRDLIGKRAEDVWQLWQAKVSNDRTQLVIDTGQPQEFVVSLVPGRRETSHVVKYFPIFDEQGQVDMVAGIAVPLEEIDRARSVLLEREERFRQMIEGSKDVLYRISLITGRFEYVSPSCKSFLGYTPEEMIEMEEMPLKMMHPDWQDFYLQEIEEVKQGRIQPYYEYQVVHKYGRPIWVHQCNSLVKDSAGRVVAVDGILMDINERKELENLLKESEFYQEISLEKSPSLMAWVAGDYITQINPSGCCILGYDTPADAVGQNIRQFVEPGFRLESIPRVGKVVGEGGTVPVVSAKWKRLDGTMIDIEYRAYLFDNLEGERLFLQAQNVTDRVKAQEKLKDAASKLTTMSRALVDAQEKERSRIARELQVEIGDSLEGMLVDMESLHHKGMDSTATQRIGDNIQLVQRLIEQIRNLSLDLRPASLEERPLEDVLRWYCDLVAKRSNLSVEFQCTPLNDCRDAVIKTTCFRVMQEALTNVVRHARASKVRVEVGQENGRLYLSIEDDGAGFSVAEALGGSAQAQKNLGLLGMRERISLIKGQFHCQSAPGRGTLIQVQMPLA